MNTLIVDSCQQDADYLFRMLEQVEPEGKHVIVAELSDILEAIHRYLADVVWVEAGFLGTDGLELVRLIRKFYPQVDVMVMSHSAQYALEAYEVFVSSYFVKPLTEKNVRESLANLRYYSQRPHLEKARLQIHCFGNFEVFWQGMPLQFQRSKTKELLAYLVDRRGAFCTIGELLGILWEDKPDSDSQRSQVRNLIHDLKKKLEEMGQEKVILRRRNEIAIHCSMVDCDYFSYLRGTREAIELYHGEYMKQYSWAEMTTAVLN